MRSPGVIYWSGNTATNGTSADWANAFSISSASTSSTTVTWPFSVKVIRGTVLRTHDDDPALPNLSRIDLPDDWRGEIRLADGTIVRGLGGKNFEVVDKDARVTYRGNRDRAFNRFLNASDLLEKFIDFLGANGVPQHRLLEVPVDVLVTWLILEAAKADGDAPPDGLPLTPLAHPRLAPILTPRDRHGLRCLWCARFIPRVRLDRDGYAYCSPGHLQRRLERPRGAASGARAMMGDCP